MGLSESLLQFFGVLVVGFLVACVSMFLVVRQVGALAAGGTDKKDPKDLKVLGLRDEFEEGCRLFELDWNRGRKLKAVIWGLFSFVRFKRGTVLGRLDLWLVSAILLLAGPSLIDLLTKIVERIPIPNS